jgi:hypothetical protein
MMHVDPQGHNECALATLAALAHVPLSTVRRTACDVARVGHWANVIDEYGKRFNIALAKVARIYGGSRLVFHVCGLCDVSGESPLKLLSKNARTLPFKGRGTVRAHRSNRHVGHIAPWEDGLIYNPTDPTTTMTLKEFRQKYGHISRITYEGEKE